MSDSLWPHGLYSPWNSPGQNTGVGSLSLLQQIFPTLKLKQVSWTAGRLFTSWAIREAQQLVTFPQSLFIQQITLYFWNSVAYWGSVWDLVIYSLGLPSAPNSLSMPNCTHPNLSFIVWNFNAFIQTVNIKQNCTSVYHHHAICQGIAQCIYFC